MTPELERLLKEAKAKVEAMSPEELEIMLKAQAESWARSIIDWPKPNYHWENGVKIYHSYEDYVND